MGNTILNNLPMNLSEFAIYAAIVLVMVVGFFKCIYPLIRNASLLNRAVVKLEKSTAAGTRPLWREPRFLGRSLRPLWQQFLQNAGQLDMRGIPCDTREYINEETVLDKPGHTQLADLIPSLLTSLGILGTFLGLMQGLTSLDFTNAEGTIESIPQLLGGMRFAFATSVVGITCSLLFNMLNRMAAGRVMKALDSFEDAFYELAMPRPLQPDVQLLCQKQDDEAKMAQFADNISAHVAASLEMAVGRAMDPLTRSLDTFVRCATREQVDGVRTIVNQFVGQMNGMLGEQLTGLSDELRSTAEAQRETQKNLHNTMAATQMMAKETQSIQQSTTEVAKQMKKLSELLEKDYAQKDNAVTETEKSGQLLVTRMENLAESLRQMQLTVDRINAELIAANSPKAGE